MLDKIRKAFKAKPEPKPEPKRKKKSEKELATEAGEPWVSVLGMEVDTDTLDQGAFELDWNDQFVTKLIRAGYQGATDADIVDQWFQAVCRNIVLETYEKDQAISREELGDGRTVYK